jgi:hypothetical protein
VSPRDGADALLDAGAVAVLGTPAGERRDALSARVYAHPVLEDREVVRLTPAALGAAEDLTMAFLGFAEPSATPEVGVVRQQVLGFPAWALVHDPANGRHALDLVKELEKLSRRAKSKPGQAKEGYDALAARLAAAVPHFLPTFYEQAARAFLAVENKTYASAYFTRAREAEQMYALEIDEDAQAASFLEFALAGAVSAKTMSAYGRGLAARRAPAEAYERFRRICVERVAGGLPPYSAMPADLKRLAKAAGRDSAAEDAALARELLPLAAVGKAATGFWDGYRVALIRAAQHDAAVRGLMLGMFPTMGGEANDAADGLWLDLLAAGGATAGLIEPISALAPEELPADGAAGWLMRFARHTSRTWHWRHYGADKRPVRGILRLVERMGPRLRAQDAVLTLAGWRSADIDLIDLCLGLGLRVADPAPEFTFELGTWFIQGSDRDLSAVAADSRFRLFLSQAVAVLAGDQGSSIDCGDALTALSLVGAQVQYLVGQGTDGRATLARFARRAAGAAGVRDVVEQWLDELAVRTADAGLADVDDLLGVWLRNAVPELLAINPGAVRRVLELDLAPYLGHALRSGIFDEYSWPALEGALDRLAAADPASRRLWGATAQWPYYIVSRAGWPTVAVVGAGGTVLEHDVSWPKSNNPYIKSLCFVSGDLFVAWQGWQSSGAYWSSDPRAILTHGGLHGHGRQEESLELPWGGRTFGGAPLAPGGATWTCEGPVASDGTDYWVYTRVGQQWGTHAWHEFDPRSGKRGRVGVPGFFEAGAPAGSTLAPTASWLVPAVPGSERSPLGQAGGLLGSRLRILADGTRVCTGVDGREAVVPATAYPWSSHGVEALLDVPGAQRRLAVAVMGPLHSLVADGTRRTARLEAGQSNRYSRGTPCLPPVRYWAFLSVRDEAGSAALRALSDTRAAALLASGRALDHATVVAAVEEHLAQVANTALRAGIVGYIEAAVDCERRIGKLAAAFKEAESAGSVASAEADGASTRVSGPTIKWSSAFDVIRAGIARGFGQHIEAREPTPSAALALLADTLTSTTPPSAGHTEQIAKLSWLVWEELVSTLLSTRALGYRAVLDVFEEAGRSAMLDFLEAVDSSGLCAPGTGLRRVALAPEKNTATPVIGHCFETAHGRAVIIGRTNRLAMTASHLDALEFSRTGEFEALPGWRIMDERRGQSWHGAASIGAFVRTACERGPLAVTPERAALLARQAGIGEVEAALLLGGLPDVPRSGLRPAATAIAAAVGAKASAVTAAAARFGRLPAGIAPGVLVAALLPADTAELWESGPCVDTAAELWVGVHGRQAVLSDVLRERAVRECSVHAVQALVNPQAPVPADAEADGSIIADGIALTVYGLHWLAYELPTGDPLRARLPAALARLRREAAMPDRQLHVGYLRDPSRFAASHGYELREVDGRKQAGPFAFQGQSVYLLPALLTGPQDRAFDVAAAGSESPMLDLASLKVLLSPELDRTVADTGPDAAETPYPAQDPARSVPDLVDEAAARRQLSKDAAALYLMLLALPDPTDRNQAAWTGWKPARLKQARAELAATDLVVTGSRARAGRTLFLPGGWRAHSAPHLPLEQWKDAYVGVRADGQRRLYGLRPLMPVADLYRTCWQRVVDGDAPRYETLESGRRR